MKTSTHKKILEVDLSIQIALVVLSIMLLTFTGKPEWAFLLFYFGLGTFQLISFLLHFKRRNRTQKTLKYTYQNFLLFVLIFAIISFASLLVPYFQGGFFMIFLVVMLILGVIMALMYIDLTTKDIYKLKRKILWDKKELSSLEEPVS